MMKRRVLKRLEEVKLSPEAGEALLERMETDTLSNDGRQRVLEVLQAELLPGRRQRCKSPSAWSAGVVE